MVTSKYFLKDWDGISSPSHERSASTHLRDRGAAWRSPKGKTAARSQQAWPSHTDRLWYKWQKEAQECSSTLLPPFFFSVSFVDWCAFKRWFTIQCTLRRLSISVLNSWTWLWILSARICKSLSFDNCSHVDGMLPEAAPELFSAYPEFYVENILDLLSVVLKWAPLFRRMHRVNGELLYLRSSDFSNQLLIFLCATHFFNNPFLAAKVQILYCLYCRW